MLLPSPIPAAIPGPVVSPMLGVNDLTTQGIPVQQQTDAQNLQSFGLGNGTPGTTTNIFAVPAGKNFAITSCKVSTGSSTQNYVQLKHGSVNMGDGYVTAGGPIDLAAGGAIIFSGGNTIQFTCGASNSGPSIGVLVGYLFDPSQKDAPGQTQIVNPDIG